jgi:hypothetical protein
MPFAELIDGPLHGQAIEVAASTKLIEVDLGNGAFASYSKNAAGHWQYGGARVPATTGSRRASIPIEASAYTTPKT